MQLLCVHAHEVCHIVVAQSVGYQHLLLDIKSDPAQTYAE